MKQRLRDVGVFVTALGVASCGGPTLRPGPEYPDSAPGVGALDIQVRVGGRAVALTNTTDRILPEGRIWLNAWYSAQAGPIGVGESVSIPISAFRDEHGQAIRGGGFFAAEAPEVIVLVQYQTDQGISGLIVVGSDTP